MIGPAPRFPVFEDSRSRMRSLVEWKLRRRRKSWLSWAAIIAGIAVAAYVTLSITF
jgi:hypothetical protein